MRHAPNPDVYAFKRECLAEYERLSERGHIDLFYGDECRVSLQPCVPYGWQFADEEVSMPSGQGGGLNCFALLSRDNRCHTRLTEETINAAWVSEQLDAFSLALGRLTVVVLDNASAHVKAVRERCAVWQERGLFVFFLPPYSPQFNIAEVLWRKLKYEWLRPEDYADKETLPIRKPSGMGSGRHCRRSASRCGSSSVPSAVSMIVQLNSEQLLIVGVMWSELKKCHLSART